MITTKPPIRAPRRHWITMATAVAATPVVALVMNQTGMGRC